jgi:hypothetical protein
LTTLVLLDPNNKGQIITCWRCLGQGKTIMRPEEIDEADRR